MIAVAAPILAEIPIGVRVPTVVIEMLLGVLVGPHVLKLVDPKLPTEPVLLMGQGGLGFLPVRICMLLLSFFIVLAGSFGFDATLGAFASGMVVGLAARGEEGKELREKLDAIGYGYFVPFFFVTSGMKLDLDALGNDPATMVMVPLFLVLLLVTRGFPVLLYRHHLAKELRLPFALYSSTALPLVVAISEIGIKRHMMLPGVAAALVGAAMLSTLIFPMAADLLLSRVPELAAQ